MGSALAEMLLTFFTSADRAAAITGDLIEECERRGRIWFWLHVVRVTFALWRTSTTEAPIHVVGLALVAGAVFAAPALAGVAAVYLFPGPATWLSWIALSSLWLGGAFWTGASLVTVSPKRGMAVCALFAVIGAASLMLLGAMVESQELSRTDRMFFTVAMGAALAFPTGAAFARRRRVLTPPLAAPIALLAAVLAPTGCGAPAARQGDWRDLSPHAATMVSVEEHVQLDVLDWGGSGPALVLLAGLGNTAHHYDDIAPVLAERYRVIGITRRGHPGSSAPPGGYDFVQLANDIRQVIDAVGLDRPIVIGHSIAGEEMHVLGARHAEAIRGLVYVDAAFNRGDDADTEPFNAVARTVPAAPGPAPADLESFSALRAYLDTYGGAGPEGYLRTRYRSTEDGRIDGLWAPEPSVFRAMADDMQASYHPYDPEPIHVPALAIYAVPTSADDLMQHGSSDRLPFADLAAQAAADLALRRQLDELYRLTRQRVDDHERWFESFADHGRTVELSGTHDLIVSNPSALLEQIDAFASSVTSR